MSNNKKYKHLKPKESPRLALLRRRKEQLNGLNALIKYAMEPIKPKKEKHFLDKFSSREKLAWLLYGRQKFISIAWSNRLIKEGYAVKHYGSGKRMLRPTVKALDIKPLLNSDGSLKRWSEK